MALYVSPFARVLWVAGAIFTAVVVWLKWPDPNATDDCGDLDVAVDTSAWRHDTRCTLRGTATNPLNITMGKVDNSKEGPAQFAGLRRFVQLNGSNVIAVLPGDRPAVAAFFAERDSLVGFRVDSPGRLIETDKDAGYQGLGIGLRKKFGLAPDVQLWLFDTDPDP